MEYSSTKQIIGDLLTREYYAVYDLSIKHTVGLIVSIFKNVGLEEVMRKDAVTIEEVIKKKVLCTKSVLPLTWMLKFLAQNRLVDQNAENGKSKFHLKTKLPHIEIEKIEKEILRLDCSFKISIDLMKKVSMEYPDYLFGRKGGTEIIFSGEKLKLWRAYFQNNFNGYKIFNSSGANFLIENIKKTTESRILELGGGTGGATEMVLKIARQKNALRRIKEYIFSDISPVFLREGNRIFLENADERFVYELKKIDFNIDLCKQEVHEETIDFVFGVNSLHAARDIDFTLKSVKKILKPGGDLIIAELIRDGDERVLFQEMIFNILDNYQNTKRTNSKRKNYGFLSEKNWIEIIKEAGFRDIETINNRIHSGNFESENEKFLMLLKCKK